MEAVNFELFKETIENAKVLCTNQCENCCLETKKRIKEKGYSNTKYWSDKLKMIPNSTFRGNKIPHYLFVEGFLIFVEPSIYKLFDKRIFIAIDKQTCYSRRMSTTAVPEKYFHKILWPHYVDFHRNLMLKKSDGTRVYQGLILDGTRSKDELFQLACDYINGKQVENDEKIIQKSLKKSFLSIF